MNKCECMEKIYKKDDGLECLGRDKDYYSPTGDEYI